MSALVKTWAAVSLVVGGYTAFDGTANLFDKTATDFQKQYPSMSAPDAEQLAKKDRINDFAWICLGGSAVLTGFRLMKL